MDRQVAKELLHMKEWLVLVDQIVALGQDEYLTNRPTPRGWRLVDDEGG